MRFKTILVWLTITAIVSVVIASEIAVINPESILANASEHQADVTLSNNKLRITYTNEAVSIGNYTNDNCEPIGWELTPSIFWDNNNNYMFEANESIGHMISPCVHFTFNSQTYHFWPLQQSIMQDPGDPQVISSGWINYSRIYASKVQDSNQLLTVECTILLDSNYFTQQVKITSTANSTLANVNLTIYIGIDINGPFNDYAFIDPTHNNMFKACDNETNVWFGACPSINASNHEISEWNDGPYEQEDLWQHTLNNNLDGSSVSAGDIEGALEFHLGEIQTNKSKTLKMHYSLGMSENELLSDIHDVTVTDVSPYQTIVGQNYNTSTGVTVTNTGLYTETFNINTYIGGSTTSEQRETFWSMGDVNRDGYIDTTDLDLITAAYGSSPGDPRWNPDADLDKDLHVGLFDLLICTGNQGSDMWTYFGLWLLIGTQTVNNLSPGTSQTVTFAWNATNLTKGNHPIKAVADTVPDETEIDTYDNTLTEIVFVGVPCDVTGPTSGVPDGVCNMRDIGYFCSKFGTTPSSLNWDANCDVTGALPRVPDGAVNMRDIGEACRNFMKPNP